MRDRHGRRGAGHICLGTKREELEPEGCGPVDRKDDCGYKRSGVIRGFQEET